ncbi:MAG: efflux RND transporter periplasmic adaptor subunit [Candidatus Zixiibacteriota bacterium]
MKRPRFACGQSYLIALTLLIILALPFLSGCSGDNGNGSGKQKNSITPAVEAVQAKFGSLPLTERLSGIVKARNQVELYPQISATVDKVLIENGEYVKSGDALIRLRDTEFREQLKQAEANLQIAQAQAKQAEAEFERMSAEFRRSTELARKNLISPTEQETAQSDAIAAEADAELARARVAQAQAVVDERREELSRAIIRAPVDGAVGNRNAEVGMLVTPNTRVFTVGQLDTVRVEIVLSDRMLSYIEENQRARISSPILPDGHIDSKIARISPFLHPVAHSTKGEIDFPNPENSLKPGMFVTTDVYYGESEQATQVPLSALWEDPATQRVGVYICRDSLDVPADLPREALLANPVMFSFVPVDVIARGAMSAGVIGVEPGAWVMTLGQDLLDDDSAEVRIRPVTWDWIEELQRLQREDLLEEIIQRQKENPLDTNLISMNNSRLEDIA